MAKCAVHSVRRAKKQAKQVIYWLVGVLALLALILLIYAMKSWFFRNFCMRLACKGHTCYATLSKMKAIKQHATYMSGQEIERKFLVEKGSAYREDSIFKQSYCKVTFPVKVQRCACKPRPLTSPSRDVRWMVGCRAIRVRDGIPSQEADQLLLLPWRVVDKRRYLVKSDCAHFRNWWVLW